MICLLTGLLMKISFNVHKSSNIMTFLVWTSELKNPTERLELGIILSFIQKRRFQRWIENVMSLKEGIERNEYTIQQNPKQLYFVVLRGKIGM